MIPFFKIEAKNPNNEKLFQSLAPKMYVPGAITPLSLRSLYYARNSGPPDRWPATVLLLQQ